MMGKKGIEKGELALLGVFASFVILFLWDYMDKYEYSPVCMVLAMILGPLARESFFQAWMIGGRSLTVFFNRPVSLGLFFFLVLVMAGPYVYQKIKENYPRRAI